MRSFIMLLAAAALVACAAPHPAPKAPDKVVTSLYDENTSNDEPTFVIGADETPPPPPAPAAEKPKPPLALEDLAIKLPKGWTEEERADNGNWYSIDIFNEAWITNGRAVVSVGEHKMPLDGCTRAKANSEANGLVADEPKVDKNGSCSVHASDARQGIDIYSRYLMLPGHPEAIAAVSALYPNHLDAAKVWRDVDVMAKSLKDKNLKAKAKSEKK